MLDNYGQFSQTTTLDLRLSKTTILDFLHDYFRLSQIGIYNVLDNYARPS